LIDDLLLDNALILFAKSNSKVSEMGVIRIVSVSEIFFIHLIWL
jgi:hypothetical protein